MLVIVIAATAEKLYWIPRKMAPEANSGVVFNRVGVEWPDAIENRINDVLNWLAQVGRHRIIVT
jgi:hypothetical protein